MKVLKDYVVLSCGEGVEQKTASGIIVPTDTQDIDDSTEETVLHAGPLVTDCAVGDKVLFKRHMFQTYTVDKKNLLVGKEEGVIAVL